MTCNSVSLLYQTRTVYVYSPIYVKSKSRQQTHFFIAKREPINAEVQNVHKCGYELNTCIH